MMKYSGELDPTKRCRTDFKPCLQTNKQVLSVFKDTDGIAYLRYYKENK
jgi:hypothetical protein